MGLVRPSARLAIVLVLAAMPGFARDVAKPAELPPASYKGQQYVDSAGCLFMRVGEGGKTQWIPRVSKAGARVCGYPPSGQRVPIASATAAAPVAEPVAEPVVKAPAAKAEAVTAGTQPSGTGPFVVAVGSFGVVDNADRAEAKVRAKGYPVTRRQLGGRNAGLTAILAGPFATAGEASAARSALVAAGFPDAMLLGP